MTYGGSRRPDLAARLRRGQRSLKSRLERPESVLSLLRAAHDSLDPESIGKLVVTRAEEWFKAPACGVFAPNFDGQVVGLSSKGMRESLSPSAAMVAKWVLGHGREFATADLKKDARLPGPAGAVLAWPMRCRTQTVAALVVMERQAAKTVPQAGHLTFLPAGTGLRGFRRRPHPGQRNPSAAMSVPCRGWVGPASRAGPGCRSARGTYLSFLPGQDFIFPSA